MKNFNKISFFSLTVGWIGLIITHIIWSNLKFDNASGGDTGVILFWASFFLIIYYGLFILLPQRWIVKLTEKLHRTSFIFLSGVYALIGFIILIGWIFLKSDFTGVFLDALVCGLIFGYTFHTLWHKKRNSIQQKHWIPILILPFAFLFIYLIAFPKLLPSLAYNSVPQYVRNKILKKTIPKFQIGDELADLQRALPGEFQFKGCSGSSGAMVEDFQYVVEVNCCKIVRIEFGSRQETLYTMGGPEKPCS